MTTISRVFTELTGSLAYLLEADIAIYTTHVVEKYGRLTWPQQATSDFLANRGSASVETYKRWIREWEYSAMLYDGSLLQLTYDFSESGIAGHRLAYIPCPFQVDEALLREEPILDVIEMYEGDSANIVLATPVRFDFDPDAASEEHAASHLTINSSECRVPCAAPLRLGHFIEFVFKHFYPHLWRVHPYLRGLSRRPFGTSALSEAQRAGVHLAWGA